jgi:hypothetical protein
MESGLSEGVDKGEIAQNQPGEKGAETPYGAAQEGPVETLEGRTDRLFDRRIIGLPYLFCLLLMILFGLLQQRSSR